MKTLWFVVPAHGRIPLAKICLRQLRRTCDLLYEHGIEASAVIVSDRDTLKELDVIGLNFAWVLQSDTYPSGKFNDGIQLATDPDYNPNPVDYVVPCGSDDWVNHSLFKEPLPNKKQIFAFRNMSFVREDGKEIISPVINYEGGCGIRIIPRELVEPLAYRPADEDRERGCDLSILRNIREKTPDLEVKHWDASPRTIVDWKTPELQLNPYREIVAVHGRVSPADPFEELAPFYPDEALNEMRDYYAELAA